MCHLRDIIEYRIYELNDKGKRELICICYTKTTLKTDASLRIVIVAGRLLYLILSIVQN